MRISVQGISPDTSERELATVFGRHGAVRWVEIDRDQRTGRMTGRATVEMPDAQEADAAIQALDRAEQDGSTLTVRRGPRADNGERALGEE